MVEKPMGRIGISPWVRDDAVVREKSTTALGFYCK
jgi:hypothetical protein